MVNDPYENSAARAGLVNRVLNGRYEVLELLGEGPLLTAYRARDKQANRIVTLKVVHHEYANDAAVVQSLREGIGEAYSLAHSAVARVFDVGTDEETGLLYLAEEYVRGIDLKERIRRAAPFQLAAATDTAIAIAEALDAAHARGIAHGDVRPQNVLIGPEGQIKLTNFGIAVAQAKVALNDPALLKRVVGYTAPDAARAAAPTRSADLYALGCMLFEMLTGDLPYTGDNPVQVALKHAQEPVPSLRSINGAIPPAMEGIVQRALEKTPEKRYGSANELLADLKAVRDALRFGKPLNWTPKERENSADRTPSVTPPPIPVAQGNVPAMPSVMPTAPVAAAKTTPPVRTATNHMATAEVVAPANAVAYPAEEEVMVRPTRSRRIQWLTLVNLFMAILLVGACAGFYWVVVSSNRPDAVVVLPSLVGKTVTEAEQIASEKNFKLAIVARSFRDTEPKDVIYQQDIIAGRSIKPGRQVPVWVSDGPRMVTVPDVREGTFDKARKTLERAGLAVGNVKPEYDPMAEKGLVINQIPPPGENKPRGTKVDLVTSKGPEPLPTPEPMPTLEPSTTGTPGGEPSPEGGASPATGPKVRYFKVVYPDKPIPPGDEPHRIRIDVLDDNGPRTIKDTTVPAGSQIRIEHVEVTGEKGSIKVYDNDELKGEINT